MKKLLICALSVLPVFSMAAQFGPSVPTRLTPEGNVLHVHMDKLHGHPSYRLNKTPNLIAEHSNRVLFSFYRRSVLFF